MFDVIAALRSWYRGSVRPLLETLDPKRTESTDADCKRLEDLASAFTEEVPVCFLGQSGIGKSTLINALIDQNLLPHGGIGPLTAQALSVRFGETNGFEVKYHSPGRVVRLAFALGQTHRAKLRKEGREAKQLSNLDLLDAVEQEDRDDFAPPPVEGEDNPQIERNRELIKQATLMIAGRPDAERELPYLIDRLREMVGKAPILETECLQEDHSRVNQIRECLVLGQKKEWFRCLQTSAGFRAALHEHATGFLAPIIRELVVRWNRDLLQRGIVLVDLPGVGIAGDVHARVTEEYIREKAKVVVLVVSVRGVTKPDADLLRTSGFLNRLLHSVDDPEADPVQLMTVVVRADDAADALRAGDTSRSKRQHFVDVCTAAVQNTTAQLREQLAEAWRTDETLSQTKQEVLDRIIKNLQVHPLSAVQYRRFLAGDEDNPPFIKDAEESNLPKFRCSLTELADSLNQARRAHLEQARNLFFSNLTGSLRLIREQWQQDARAQEEAEVLARNLKAFLEPIREEFHTRRGEFRAFLRETIPSEIEKLVLEARDSARPAIRRYVNSLEGVSWATLRAAVRRGGVFAGARHIDLPQDFALRFEEPLAEIWGKNLLQLIRKRTKAYADDCVTLVEQIFDWAKNGGAHVKTTLLEAQRDQIKADAQQLTAVEGTDRRTA